MADMFTPTKRSAIMARIRSRGNKTTELRFILLLRKYRISGWRRGTALIGQPDFVFHRSRVVVFIDGDFWHGNPRGFRLPKSNIDYWRAKIERNRCRDRLVNRLLRAKGWTVLRIWESSLSREVAVVARLRRAMAKARALLPTLPSANFD